MIRVMKGIAASLALCIAPAAWAGMYHVNTTLRCSDCHTMHASMAHKYGAASAPGTAGTQGGDWLPPGGPNMMLLKAADQNTLCLQCHDGKSFAPDVLGAHTNGYVRQGGALTNGNKLAEGAAPYERWKGHTLDAFRTQVPPGGGAGVILMCTSCHNAHGSDNFRNIDGFSDGGAGSTPISYALGTNDTKKDVFLRSWTQGDLAGNYGVDSTDFNQPDTTRSAYGEFCQSCHFKFHGAATDSTISRAGAFIRHPTAGVSIGANTAHQGSSLAQFGSKAFRVKVMSASGDWGPTGSAWSLPPATLTPSCFSCHKAHGNQNGYGLIYLDGSGPLTEEGDTAGVAAQERSLCTQCHVQANP
jgi:hypothetical protein